MLLDAESENERVRCGSACKCNNAICCANGGTPVSATSATAAPAAAAPIGNNQSENQQGKCAEPAPLILTDSQEEETGAKCPRQQDNLNVNLKCGTCIH